MVALIASVFVEVLLPILLMAGAGWALDRRAKLDLSTIAKLNIQLFVPVFIFVEIVLADLGATFSGTPLRVIAFTASVIAVVGFLAWGIGGALRLPSAEKRSLQIAAMFYNSGNFGIPLMQLAYGPAGSALQVFIVMVQNLANFTVGIFLLATPDKPRSFLDKLRPMLRQGSIWALLIGLAVHWFAIPITGWNWLWKPLRFIHDGLVPLALVSLGAQLSKTKLGGSLRRIAPAVALRLLGGPLAGWALSALFGFTGELRDIMIVSASFPSAVNTALLAHEFKADAEYAAATVFYSTVLSVFTVTPLIALLRV
jgi:predicted permease